MLSSVDRRRQTRFELFLTQFLSKCILPLKILELLSEFFLSEMLLVYPRRMNTGVNLKR